MPALDSILPPPSPEGYVHEELVEGEAGGPSVPSQPFVTVLVGGFLVPPNEEFDEAYWGEGIRCRKPHQEVIVVHPSPIASLHDRVCQIFYELKGGQVNYGKGHSDKYGHDQFGRTFPGIYPEWDADHPVHLIGHSYGGLTIRLLVHYLENNAFVGHHTSCAWVKSVTSLNSPHNGTHLVYGLGADPRHPPVVHWGSPGHLLGTVAHLIEYLDIDALRILGIDFGLQYWKLSWKRGGVVPGLLRVLKAALGLSNVTTTADNAAYEMTLHAAEHYNRITTTYPSLYYFSFVGTMPWQPRTGDGVGWARFMIKNASYLLMAAHVSLVDFGRYSIFDSQSVPRWLQKGQSDGVVPVESQKFPRNAPHVWGLPKDLSSILSGVWYAQKVAVDHIGIVGYPTSATYQAEFFTELYEVLDHCQRLTPAPPHSRLRETGCCCEVSGAGTSSFREGEGKRCPLHGPGQTPSTRMMNCDLRFEELHQQHGASRHKERGDGWWASIIAWCLVAVSLFMYMALLWHYPKAFLLCLVALETLQAAGGAVALVLAPSRLDMLGQRLWKLNLLGMAFGFWSIATTLTLLHLPPKESSSWLQSRLLLACAFYAHNLWGHCRDGFFKRHVSTVAYQTLMLVLFVSSLNRGDLGSESGMPYLMDLLVMSMLGEIHSILVLAREILILSGYLEIIEDELIGGQPGLVKPPLSRDISTSDMRRRPSFTSLSENPNSHLQMSFPRRSTVFFNDQVLASRKRVASLIWVGIWLSFFLCQVAPSLYVALWVTPSFYAHLNDWAFSTSVGRVASVLAATLVVLSLNRIKSLSVNFQMDYGKH